jgi:hypothetical protein
MMSGQQHLQVVYEKPDLANPGKVILFTVGQHDKAPPISQVSDYQLLGWNETPEGKKCGLTGYIPIDTYILT